MTGVSTFELAEAREAAAELLETLGLAAYLFEVEPRAGGEWELRVDCAVDGGWQSTTLSVEKAGLLASRTDATRREALLAAWRTRLSACTRR